MECCHLSVLCCIKWLMLNCFFSLNLYLIVITCRLNHKNCSFIKTAYLTQNARTVNHHCQDNYGVTHSFTQSTAGLIPGRMQIFFLLLHTKDGKGNTQRCFQNYSLILPICRAVMDIKVMGRYCRRVVGCKLNSHSQQFISLHCKFLFFKLRVIPLLTHCGRVTQICVFNTVKLGTSASSP
jgi:hypothetical protein